MLGDRDEKATDSIRTRRFEELLNFLLFLEKVLKLVSKKIT
jgi:hypothetical protein